MRRVFPILGVLTAVLLSYGLYEALIGAPTEQTMGDIQRIFYYHVPSAWTAGVLFFINFAASVVYLVRLNPRMERFIAMVGNGIASALLIACLAWPGYSWTVRLSLAFSVAAIWFLFWRLGARTSQGRADAWAVSTAEVGTAFCTVVL